MCNLEPRISLVPRVFRGREKERPWVRFCTKNRLLLAANVTVYCVIYTFLFFCAGGGGGVLWRLRKVTVLKRRDHGLEEKKTFVVGKDFSETMEF